MNTGIDGNGLDVFIDIEVEIDAVMFLHSAVVCLCGMTEIGKDLLRYDMQRIKQYTILKQAGKRKWSMRECCRSGHYVPHCVVQHLRLQVRGRPSNIFAFSTCLVFILTSAPVLAIIVSHSSTLSSPNLWQHLPVQSATTT